MRHAYTVGLRSDIYKAAEPVRVHVRLVGSLINIIDCTFYLSPILSPLHNQPQSSTGSSTSWPPNKTERAIFAAHA